MLADVLLAAAAATACTLQDERVAESSGLAASRSRPGIVYTHNDSGNDPQLFAVDLRSCAVGEPVTVTGATNVDWEDLALGPKGTLWIGDIGDNDSERESITVYRVPEPAAAARRVQATAIRLRYEDGASDAEALLVHPRTGELVVVTKSPFIAVVYAARDGVLQRETTIPFRPTGTRGGPDLGVLTNLLVTGGAVAPTGDRVALRTYTDVYEWWVGTAGIVAALRDDGPVRTPLPPTRQGEAVAYAADGATLLLTTEGATGPVHRVPSALGRAQPTSNPAAPTTASPSATGSPPAAPQQPAAEEDDADRPWWVWPAFAAVLTGAAVVLTRRRRPLEG